MLADMANGWNFYGEIFVKVCVCSSVSMHCGDFFSLTFPLNLSGDKMNKQPTSEA